jgi:uncharacterized membrane protein YeaQ/YmgE (transglycosylase-associated protein family)
MGCFQVIWSLVLGFVIGLLARALLPGGDQMGFIMTTILGVVGSFVGAFLGGLISKPTEGSKFHPAGIFLSIVGAMVLLLLWRFLR